MNPRNWLAAVTRSSHFSAAWVQACGLRDDDATHIDTGTTLETQKCEVDNTWNMAEAQKILFLPFSASKQKLSQ